VLTRFGILRVTNLATDFLMLAKVVHVAKLRMTQADQRSCKQVSRIIGCGTVVPGRCGIKLIDLFDSILYEWL
jgi:hypothetical protein